MRTRMRQPQIRRKRGRPNPQQLNALIGLGSVAALYQITEGMPGRVTD